MSTSLSDLITQVRMRSNMENNFFVTNEELTYYINNSLAELYDIIVTEYEDYRINEFIASIPNDGYSNVISIPSDMHKLRGVDFKMSPGSSSDQWLTLDLFMFRERNRQNSVLGNIVSPYGRSRLMYRLSDQGISIVPQSQAAGVFRVWYIPKWSPLLQLTDVLPIQLDTQAWVEYAIVDCCIKINNKQNLDPSGFMAEKAALKERIIGAARNRDSAGPKRVVNTRFVDDGFDMPYFFGTW